MPKTARAIACVAILANLIAALVFAPAFGEASYSASYQRARLVLDQMVKSGAVTVDESKATIVEGIPGEYRGDPALPILNAVWKSSRSYRAAFPAGLLAANMLAFLILALIPARPDLRAPPTPR